MIARTNEEFADAIRLIRGDQQLYEKMVRDSEDISKQYSEESIYAMWKHFYSQCVLEGRKQ